MSANQKLKEIEEEKNQDMVLQISKECESFFYTDVDRQNIEYEINILRERHKGKYILPLNDYAFMSGQTEMYVQQRFQKAIFLINEVKHIDVRLLDLGGRKKNDIRTSLNKNFIYLLEAKGLNRYKIGIAASIKDRVKRIQTSSPVEIIQLHFVYLFNVFEKERDLHEKFKKYRVIGEWFELNETQLKELINEMDKLK